MRLSLFQRVLTLFFFTFIIMNPLSSKAAPQTAPMEQITNINGLALAPQNSSGEIEIYAATQYGLLQAGPNGIGTLAPDLKVGLMALAVHPENPKTLLTSGYTRDGKDAGVLKSTDGGKSWTKISNDVAFHHLVISGADPNTVYAVDKVGIKVSRDGGKSWKEKGTLPKEMYGFTASSVKRDTLYAAAKEGLLISRDGGAKWSPAYSIRNPATMIHATPEGRLYAFVIDVGLLTAKEPSLTWKVVSKDFQDRYLMNLIVDPKDSKRLYVTADSGAILISGDGGETWESFEGSYNATAENIAKGKKTFETICQECHGVKGIGENPKDPEAQDEFGFLAPALNNDAHAWHHSDSNIKENVQKGSDRNERMIAFKDVLADEEIDNVITYIKTLWNFRSLACQGVRHMSCK